LIDLDSIRLWECEVRLYLCTHRTLVLCLHDTVVPFDPDGRAREYFVICYGCKELPRLPLWNVATMHKHRIDDIQTWIWDEATGVSFYCSKAYVRLGFDEAIQFFEQNLELPSAEGFVNAPDDVLHDGRD